MNNEQFEKIRTGQGFIAALDQSGGSTPKALQQYGLGADSYSSDDEMYTRMHEMRCRIVTSPSFNGDRILGSILFENTMDRQIEGQDSAEYLWSKKAVVPFLKVDKGLADEVDGAQVLKPIDGLENLLGRASKRGIFGTKMRSLIKMDGDGVQAVVDQQFQIGAQILSKGLVPIIEPEIDIHSPEKAAAEETLKKELRYRLDALRGDQHVMLKLTLPEIDNFYSDFVEHPRVLRVVALSGGYSRVKANELLARNTGLVASFSRALTEGLSAQQSDEEFDKLLDESIGSIFEASMT